MSTITNISASTLSVAGSTSISSYDNDSINSIGTTATLGASTISTVGGSGIMINVKAAELEQTKSYIQSLSIEEKQKLNQMLIEKENMLNNYENTNVKVKTKSIN